MKIHRFLDSVSTINNPILTIGTFDGVHRGHRAIIDRINEISRQVQGESVLLTFDPHPRKVLFEDIGLDLITSMDEKISLLEEAGLNHLIIHPFDRKFSRISAVSYARDLLVNQIGVHTVVVGYDHHFGRNREGDIESMREFSQLYEFDLEEISAQTIDDVEISSTKIRAAVKEGKVELAKEYLGHPFSISGEVVRGRQIGRKLGFPTANIRIDEADKILPAHGVYAVKVLVNGNKLNGMLNIGERPTVDSLSKQLSIEVNIFDLDEDIYSATIRVEFFKRIRNETKFDGTDALIEQLEMDKTTVSDFFAAHS